MKIPVHLIISLIGIFQVLYMSLFLVINKKTRNTNNYILAAILFLVAIQIAALFAISRGIWPYFMGHHKPIFFLFQFSLLLPPLICFYNRSLIEKRFSFEQKHLLHFIPFIGIVSFSAFYLYDAGDFVILQSPLRFYSALITTVQYLVYVVLIVLLWRKKKLHPTIENVQTYSRQWILPKTLLSGLMLLWMLNLNMFILLDVFGKMNLCPYTTTLYFYSVFLLINVFLFIILYDPSLLVYNNLVQKYRKSSLNSTDKNALYDQVLLCMQVQKPYLDPDFGLPDLSRILSIPIRDLSQVINERAGRNFYDFVNAYRIEESKKLLKSYQRKDKYISEIFYASGFNSKSTFNTVFKKFTGFTPSEFQASQN